MSYSHPTRSRGFTLIELLVVIAIIGILSSVVLASLNTARNKGSDSGIKSNLSTSRAQAELYYDANGSFTGVCGATPVNGVKTIFAQIYAASQAAGLTNGVQVNAIGGSGKATCNATASGWAAEVPLKTSTGFFCTDYLGSIGTTSASTLTSTSDVACN